MKLTVTLADGATHTVYPNNIDRMKWDLTRGKQGWPTLDQAPFIGMTFLSWNAMRREGIYSDSWQQFSEVDCVDITGDDDDDEAPKSTSGEVSLELQ